MNERDTCRPVTGIDGEPTTIRVRAAEEMSEENREAFGEIVRAAQRRLQADIAARNPADYPLDAVLDGDLVHKAKAMGALGIRVSTLCGLNARHVPGRDGGMRCPECAAMEQRDAARAKMEP